MRPSARPPALLARRAPAEALAGEVRGVLAARPDAAYVPVAVDADGLGTPLAWLAAQTARPRVYWHGRDDARRVAALGAALSLGGDALGALRPTLATLGPDARLYGGFRFDPLRRAEPGAWHSSEAFRLTLPLVTYEADADGRGRLVAHVLPHQPDAAARLLRTLGALREPAPLDLRLPLPIARHDLPSRDDWRRTVEAALDAFRRGPIEKVVPARRVTFDFAEATLDPFALLARLEAATPGTYHFLTEHGPHAAFVSASPERLFRMEGRRVWTEALAGTRPRGATRAEDAALATALHASNKDQREHGYVRDFIARVLDPLATDVRADARPEDAAFARGRHLRTPIEALLRPGVAPLDVLEALHPTPAVGGTPSAEALAFLRHHEPFDRGRYAAPVGWMSRDAAEFSVALRCGRVEPNRLALYSGAGVVEGSDPDAEWAEIEGKIGDFVAILGLDAR